MKVGIDISQIQYEGTGVAAYTRNLVENLVKVDKKNSYVLFFSSLRGKVGDLKIEGKKAILKRFRFSPAVLDLLWNRMHVLPIEKLIGKIDVFHSSDWTQPSTGAKRITTIHDLTPVKYPETLDPKIVQVHKKRLYWVKKESDLVICVSKSTQQDVVELLGIAKEKTRVIYEGAGEEYGEFKTQSNKIKAEKIQEVRGKYEVKGDYILAVGTREPRKNLARLVAACNSLRLDYPGLELVIAGKYGWGKDVEKLTRDDGKVKILGYVKPEDMPALYSGARCFVYPSLYEGFGLPVVDAMSLGTVVVCSSVSSLPEVGGEAAIYCEPDSVASITRAIGKALRLDGDELGRVKLASLKQAAKFSWKKTASKTIKVYQEVFTNS